MNWPPVTALTSFPGIFGAGSPGSGSLWLEGSLAAMPTLAPVIPMFPSLGTSRRRLPRQKT